MKSTSKLILGAVICVASPAVMAQDWNYGIGTGPAALAVDGDIGFNTVNFGPVDTSIDLDAGDTSDLLDTAFGLGGYATNGTWTISGGLGRLTLEGRAYDAPTSLSAEFEVTTGELMVGYNLSRSESLSVDLLGGVRYLNHELSAKLSQAGSTQIKRSVENDWTDAVVGISFGVPLNSNWTWNTRFDAAGGGSEGTYSANTGLVWRFADAWSATFYAQLQAIEFEEGNKGDSDWYLYDVDETKLGFTILYNW